MAETTLSSSLALKQLGGENPFSPDRIRERRELTFPEVDRSSLTKRQQKFYDRTTEHVTAIALTGVKGAFAAAEVAALEDFVDARFEVTTIRMARRLQLTHRLTPNQEFRAVQTVFAVEAAKRMGVTMVGIADATEQAVQKLVERPVSEEELSLLRLLLSRRR